MESFNPRDLPAAVRTGGVEIGARELGGMVILYYRFARGADLRAALRGLPGDTCPCPHWAFVLSGKLRIHTAAGAREVAAGEAFYVEPGHYPEALEETEMFEVSRAEELRPVAEHLLRQLAVSHPLAS